MARWDQTTADEIPEWFWQTIAVKSDTHSTEVEGCDVFYRRWGTRAGTPLLFIHGMYAHSRWWDFIAPQFLEDYDPIALDLTGMGDSDFRYEYDGTTYAAEIRAVCEHAKLGDDVIVVGHSFGGRMAVKACSMFSKSFKALVLVDSGIHSPDEQLPEYPPIGGGRAKTYPNRESAETRFRLYPPQPCENQFLLEYIARNSVMAVEGGYCWKYDEDLPNALTDVEADASEFQALKLPVALIYGENSLSFTSETLAYSSDLLSNLVTTEKVESAQHHVFLDQPLAFIETLHRVLKNLR